MAQAVSTLRELCTECAFAPPPTRSAGQPVRIDKGELTQKASGKPYSSISNPEILSLSTVDCSFGAAALSLPDGAEVVVQPLWGLSAIPCPPRLARKPPVPIGG